MRTSQQSLRIVELRTTLKRDIAAIETQVDALLERIIVSTSSSAYDRKVEALEKEKLSLSEQMQDPGSSNFFTERDLLELSCAFLSNFWKIWENGNLTMHKLVLRLAFSAPMTYSREQGIWNTKKPFLFNILDKISTNEKKWCG